MMNLFKNIEFTDEEDEIMDQLVRDIPLDDEPEAEEPEEMSSSTPANPGSGVGNVHIPGPLQKKKQPAKSAKKQGKKR